MNQDSAPRRRRFVVTEDGTLEERAHPITDEVKALEKRADERLFADVRERMRLDRIGRR